ncbi:hypothetical protein Tco_1055428 [Tanacetum coccineum]|uniref:Uncharacterized protein n=1 Tax=Tanacetum coccineum TaxID=301880 RepID=A0ABQ5H0T4_9ASTR
MEELPCRQFMEDKFRGMQVVVLGVILQGLTELRELIQQVRQRLFAATTVKWKATWQDSAPNLKVLGIQQDVLSEVQIHDSYLDNHAIKQNVQEMQYSKQPVFNNDTDIDITSDSNMISYEQYLKETENTIVQDTSSFAQQDAMIMSVIEEMSTQVAKCNEVDKVNKAVNESLTAELERYKEQIKLFEERQQFDLNDREKYIDGQLRKAKEDKYLDEIIELEKKKKASDNVVYKMGQLTQTMHMLTKPQVFYDESHKTTIGYQNPLYLTQSYRKVPALYCGNTIVKQHDALSVIDTEETLELAEESRLKMHAKQNDPIMQEKKVNISPIDYVALNKLSEHFVKHFVPQKQLSAKQAFWLPISKPVSETPPVQPEPIIKEIPHELPIISLVKDSFNKMRNHVNDFENAVTVYTKVTAQNEGS